MQHHLPIEAIEPPLGLSGLCVKLGKARDGSLLTMTEQLLKRAELREPGVIVGKGQRTEAIRKDHPDLDAQDFPRIRPENPHSRRLVSRSNHCARGPFKAGQEGDTRPVKEPCKGSKGGLKDRLLLSSPLLES